MNKAIMHGIRKTADTIDNAAGAETFFRVIRGGYVLAFNLSYERARDWADFYPGSIVIKEEKRNETKSSASSNG